MRLQEIVEFPGEFKCVLKHFRGFRDVLGSFQKSFEGYEGEFHRLSELLQGGVRAFKDVFIGCQGIRCFWECFRRDPEVFSSCFKTFPSVSMRFQTASRSFKRGFRGISGLHMLQGGLQGLPGGFGSFLGVSAGIKEVLRSLTGFQGCTLEGLQNDQGFKRFRTFHEVQSLSGVIEQRPCGVLQRLQAFQVVSRKFEKGSEQFIWVPRGLHSISGLKGISY